MLLIVYSSGIMFSFSLWFSAFQKDQATPKTDVLSWAVLLIAALAWPISLPLSLFERSLHPQEAN